MNISKSKFKTKKSMDASRISMATFGIKKFWEK